MARYDVERRHGMYVVVDVETGLIAKVNDRWLEGLSVEDADDMADLLNREEANRPAQLS
jgi:hypothetical protein